MHNRFRDIFGAIDKWNRNHLTKAWIKTVLYFGSIVRRANENQGDVLVEFEKKNLPDLVNEQMINDLEPYV